MAYTSRQWFGHIAPVTATCSPHMRQPRVLGSMQLGDSMLGFFCGVMLVALTSFIFCYVTCATQQQPAE
jgi:hypothetical protein